MSLTRQQQAQHIIENPQDYKVCEGCSSIVTARSCECPNCRAYAFNVYTPHVIAQARLLASRDPLSVAPGDLGA